MTEWEVIRPGADPAFEALCADAENRRLQVGIETSGGRMGKKGSEYRSISSVWVRRPKSKVNVVCVDVPFGEKPEVVAPLARSELAKAKA